MDTNNELSIFGTTFTVEVDYRQERHVIRVGSHAALGMLMGALAAATQALSDLGAEAAATGRSGQARIEAPRAEPPTRVEARVVDDAPPPPPEPPRPRFPAPVVTEAEQTRGLMTLAGVGPVDTEFPRLRGAPPSGKGGNFGAAKPSMSGYMPTEVRRAILENNDRLSVRERTFLVYSFGLDGKPPVALLGLGKAFGLESVSVAATEGRVRTYRQALLAKIGLKLLTPEERKAKFAVPDDPEVKRRVDETMRRIGGR